jgi:hypothetical protein
MLRPQVKVIPDEAFLALVENVREHARKDVCDGQILPEGLRGVEQTPGLGVCVVEK